MGARYGKEYGKEFIMSNALQHIQQKLETQKVRLQREYNVQRIGVFGSFIRGDQNPTSDIDILVELSEPIGLFRFVGLEHRLEELLGRDVDLVTPRALKSSMKDDVLRQVVYV